MMLVRRGLKLTNHASEKLGLPLLSLFYPVNQHYSKQIHGRSDLRKFIDQVGSDPKDMKFWFRVFQHQDVNPSKPFAVVQIENNVFASTKHLHKLVESIDFLQQNGLCTVIVIGSDNNENTSQQLTENTVCMTEMLEQLGAKTRPFLNSAGLVTAKRDSVIGGRCSKIEVDVKPIIWSLSSNCIPIIASYYHDINGNPIYISPIDMVNEISLLLQPLKVMYINTQGGIVGKLENKVVSNVNFPNDLDVIHSFDEESKLKMMKITNLLKNLPYTSSAVITSADTVIRELFTHGGAGTLLKNYESLHSVKSLKDLDVNKLVELLEHSFQKHLKSHYILSLKDKLCKIYVTESYSAAAIITNESLVKDIPYLCKFAVLPENQGLGAGESLWHEIDRDFPALFWRSRNKNRINPWYFARAEGSWRSKKYTTFWYGIDDPKLSYNFIGHTNDIDSSFIEVEKLALS